MQEQQLRQFSPIIIVGAVLINCLSSTWPYPIFHILKSCFFGQESMDIHLFIEELFLKEMLSFGYNLCSLNKPLQAVNQYWSKADKMSWRIRLITGLRIINDPEVEMYSRYDLTVSYKLPRTKGFVINRREGESGQAAEGRWIERKSIRYGSDGLLFIIIWADSPTEF